MQYGDNKYVWNLCCPNNPHITVWSTALHVHKDDLQSKNNAKKLPAATGKLRGSGEYTIAFLHEIQEKCHFKKCRSVQLARVWSLVEIAKVTAHEASGGDS